MELVSDQHPNIDAFENSCISDTKFWVIWFAKHQRAGNYDPHHSQSLVGGRDIYIDH